MKSIFFEFFKLKNSPILRLDNRKTIKGIRDLSTGAASRSGYGNEYICHSKIRVSVETEFFLVKIVHADFPSINHVYQCYQNTRPQHRFG